MILRIRLPSGATERVTLSVGEELSDLGRKINDLNRLHGQFSLYSDPRFTNPFIFQTARHGDIIFIRGTELPTPTPTSQTPQPPTSSPATQNPPPSATAKTTTTTTTTSPTPTPPTPPPRKGPGPRCRHGPRGMCEHCMPREDKRARAAAELRKHNGKGSSIAVLEALDALKFKISPQSTAHAAAAAINSDAAHAFQAYLATTAFSQQRVGFCYGTVTHADALPDADNSTQGAEAAAATNHNNSDSKHGKSNGDANLHANNNEGEPTAPKQATCVLAVYEPPQCGSDAAYKLVDGPDAGDMTQRADTLSNLLGLHPVGMVISARPRSCILSAMDVVFAARQISKLPEEQRKAFIIFVVTTAETGETLFEAYQISDLAVEMYQADVFEDVSKQKANGGRVLCKEDVLVEGKDTRKVPTEFFLLNVPIKSCDSWLRTKFTIENRDITPQGPAELNKIVTDESLEYQKRLADFHLLLFLSNVFDMKADMPGLCASVKANEPIGEGYRLMIDNMASSS